MKTLNTLIEPNDIDYSVRYRFDPLENGRCRMSRKGQLVLHRRLVSIVFGTNFPKTHLKIVEQSDENGHFHSLILKPVNESQPDRITVFRYRYGALLVLNSLFYKLGLNYKRFQFSFVSEPVTFDDESIGIRLTHQDTSPWPEFVNRLDESKAEAAELVEIKQAILSTNLITALASDCEPLKDRQAIEEEQFRALFVSFLDWKASQQNQKDGFEFEQNFVNFSRQINQALFQIARPKLK